MPHSTVAHNGFSNVVVVAVMRRKRSGRHRSSCFATHTVYIRVLHSQPCAVMVNVSDDATNKTKETKFTEEKKNENYTENASTHAGCGEGEMRTCTMLATTTPIASAPTTITTTMSTHLLSSQCTHNEFLKNILGDEDNMQATIR